MEETEESIGNIVTKVMFIIFIFSILAILLMSSIINWGAEDFWFGVITYVWLELAIIIIGFALFYKPIHKWLKELFMQTYERDKKAGKL